MNQCGARISSRDAYIMDNLYTWCGTAAYANTYVFTNMFYGKDGVCLALLGRLMNNIRYVRDNYLFKINNRSDNFRMHLAGNRSSTTANLEAGDGLSVMAEGQPGGWRRALGDGGRTTWRLETGSR